jgi:uncharacterized protein with GYD domain
MAKYLLTGSYSADGAKGLINEGGTKRQQAVTAALTSVGMSVEAFYFALGEYDIVLIADAPDHLTVTAMALAVNSAGALKLSTTVLLTPSDVDAAVKKPVKYTPPSH